MFLTSWRTFHCHDELFWHLDVLLTSRHIFDVMTNCLTSWLVYDVMTSWTVWGHDVFWRHDEILDVMTCFWHSDELFDFMMCIWCHDEFVDVMTNFMMAWRNVLTSWRTFDFKTYFWRHEELFDVRNFLTLLCILTSWQTFWRHYRLFNVMTCPWRHDVVLTPWRTCWRHDELPDVMTIFWRHDVFWRHKLLSSWRVLRHNKLLNVMT